ncbi:hypothetical protein [Campylobacter volucris]|nr:hypothetical protein [Campylobacter volucris]
MIEQALLNTSKDFIYTPVAFKFETDGSKFENTLCKKDILSMELAQGV